MTGISSLLTQPTFQALGWALVHFLWQGALVALVVACCNLWLRNSAVRVRYAVSCLFMLVLLVLPVVTFVALISQPDSLPTEARSGAALVWGAQVPSTDSALRPGIVESVARLLPLVVAIWMWGVVLLSIHWMAAWACLRRLRASASLPIPAEWNDTLQELKRRVAVSSPVRLCISRLAQAPSVVGWLRPVILMPAAALAGLDRRTLEAVLAHELAHVRRHDYVVNLLQVAVETLLFYHPAVWWVSKQIRVERENCCDDAAAGVCGDRVIYARALVDLEQTRAGQRSAEHPSLALAANGGSLMRRVERLLRGTETAERRGPSWLSPLAGLVIVACAVAGLHPSIRASGRSAPSFAVEPHEMVPTASAHPAPQPRPRPSVVARALAAPSPQTQPSRPRAASEPTPQAAAESSQHEDFLAGMAAAGFHNLTVDQLIDLKTHGVTPEFARSVEQAGFANVTPEQLINLRIHGVDAGFMRELKVEGLADLSLEALVNLRIHGVTPDFIGELKNAGYTGLKAEQLTNLRIHGVDGGFVRAMKADGLTHLSPDDLVNLRIHGVSPDFIAEMKSAGYSGLSAEKLTDLRIHGVDGEYVRGLKANGLSSLSLDDLVSLRIHGVGPDFITEMKGAGYSGLSAQQYQELRIHGVDAAFVRHLDQTGFKNLSVQQLIRLRQDGI